MHPALAGAMYRCGAFECDADDFAFGDAHLRRFLLSSGRQLTRPDTMQAADESVLTPRFYTTDFDEMEQLFSQDLNPNLDMAELEVWAWLFSGECALLL